MAINPNTPIARYFEGFDPNRPLRIRDITDRALLSNQYDLPLTLLTGGFDSARQKFGFSAITDRKYEWIYDGELPVSTTITQAVSQPTSLGNDVEGNPVYPESTFTVANVALLHPNMVLQVPVPVAADPDNDGQIAQTEFMLVRSVNYDTGQITVRRGFGATPVYAYTAGTTVTIVGTAGVEDQEWVANYVTRRGTVHNYYQLFFGGWADPQIQRILRRNYGAGDTGGDEVERQRRKLVGGSLGGRNLTGWLPLQVEKSIMYGRPFAGNPDINLPSTFGGITSFPIHRPVFTNTLTYENVMDVLQNIYMAGGEATTMICAPDVKRIISGWALSARQNNGAGVERAERTFGVIVDVIETDFGTIDVVMSRHMRRGEAFIVNTNEIGLLTAIPWTEAELDEPNTPLVQRYMYYAMFGFVLQHPLHHAWVRIESAATRFTGDPNIYNEPPAQPVSWPGVVV